MNQPLELSLQQRFGFQQFQPGQREVIEHLLAGRSAAAVFPTGGGKSLCYQLPALLLDGVTLVVSPLIALMKDQIDALARRGIAAARLDSSLDATAYVQVMRQLRDGSLRLLYVAPERFNNERFRAAISGLQIALFAVDEAHCLSEWGHNFRPDYLKLAGIARTLGAQRVLALTATATEPVLEDICRLFQIEPQCAVRTSFYRSNLQLLTTEVSAEQRDAQLLRLLAQRAPGPGIVYVTRQKTAEDLARMLEQNQCSARPYHAGMKPEERSAVQEWFLKTEHALVVATIAFGMGVDKPDIRYVYHYNPPKSLENYAQEIGRAGRDGLPSICHLLYCPGDLYPLQNFIYGDTPEPEAVQQLIQTIFNGPEQLELSLIDWSNRLNIRLLVLRTLLTYLELDGYLQEGTPYYNTYRFQPKMPSARILARVQGERREFLAGLFRQSVKARTWFDIDLARSAAALQCDRQRIVKALDWLGEQQMLEVQVSGLQQRFQRLRKPEEPTALAQTLYQRLQQRKAAELQRLQQVVDMITQSQCRSAMLAAHFGEILGTPCGTCSACLGEVLARDPTPQPAVPTHYREEVMEFLYAYHEVLHSAKRLCGFLCGCSSPLLVRAKLIRHRLFGALSDIPYARVLQWSAKRITELRHEYNLD